jgi:hypothetical protein
MQWVGQHDIIQARQKHKLSEPCIFCSTSLAYRDRTLGVGVRKAASNHFVGLFPFVNSHLKGCLYCSRRQSAGHLNRDKPILEFLDQGSKRSYSILWPPPKTSHSSWRGV